jgi:hypothetical protein
VLSFLSYARVSFAGGLNVKARGERTYQSVTTLFVTQSGFPWGRTVLPATESSSSRSGTIDFGDPGRFGSLAVYYAEFANGDPVQSRVKAALPFSARMFATAEADPNGERGTVPFIDVFGAARTPKQAIEASVKGSETLRSYIVKQQSDAGIAPGNRVQLEVLKKPNVATLLSGPKKTAPVLVFFVVLASVFGLMVVLENVRPRPEALPLLPRLQDGAYRPSVKTTVRGEETGTPSEAEPETGPWAEQRTS